MTCTKPMSSRGMGAIYERTSDGRRLRNRMYSKVRKSYLLGIHVAFFRHVMPHTQNSGQARATSPKSAG